MQSSWRRKLWQIVASSRNFSVTSVSALPSPLPPFPFSISIRRQVPRKGFPWNILPPGNHIGRLIMINLHQFELGLFLVGRHSLHCIALIVSSRGLLLPHGNASANFSDFVTRMSHLSWRKSIYHMDTGNKIACSISMNFDVPKKDVSLEIWIW